MEEHRRSCGVREPEMANKVRAAESDVQSARQEVRTFIIKVRVRIFAS